MNSCETCSYRKYSDLWGGPICKIFGHSVRDADRYLDCKTHKEKQKVEVENER